MRRAFIDLLLRDDQPVAVVVHVRVAHAALAAAKNAELADARRLQQVGQEEVVTRAVHRVGRYGDKKEISGLTSLRRARAVVSYLCHNIYIYGLCTGAYVVYM